MFVVIWRIVEAWVIFLEFSEDASVVKLGLIFCLRSMLVGPKRVC